MNSLLEALNCAKNPDRAKQVSSYFKTQKGQYGEGDIFIGISMPELRNIVKYYTDLPLSDVIKLLHNEIHEYRMAALIILVNKFKKYKKQQDSIFEIYLKNLKYVNNWDLVDVSCRDIVGAFLEHKDRSILDELAEQNHLWTQRVAMVSTWFFIRKGQFTDALRIAEKLLNHRHDLIHKAVGWMLREIAKRDELVIEEFIETHIRQMHRTTLRYAIERFSETKRRYYLAL